MTARRLLKVLLNWDDKGAEAFTGPKSRSTFNVHVTGWSKGLDVTSGGSGIVSHAGWCYCGTWLTRRT
jgi:hypothetical protein